MRRLIMVAALSILLAGVAEAKMPSVNATCPTGIQFHADEGGPAYINGKEAKLKKQSGTAFEAKRGSISIDVVINPDKSLSVSYTGKGGANGICQVADKPAKKKKSAGACPPDVSEADRYKYPACNKEKGVNLSDLKGMDAIAAIDVMTARGFTSVDTITSGETLYGIFYNRATKQCIQLTNADGKVYAVNDIKTHPKCH